VTSVGSIFRGGPKALFRQPSGVLFAEIHVKVSFGRQNVDGQAAMPESDAKPQLGLAFEVDLIFVDGDFENPLERGFRHELRI
jgi:hypothetical protein